MRAPLVPCLIVLLTSPLVWASVTPPGQLAPTVTPAVSRAIPPIPPAPSPASRVDAFPARPADALTGSAFAAHVAHLSESERYAATHDQVVAGNVPDFLRALVPIALERPAGVQAGPHEVTVFVTPDYLSVGTNEDHLTLPLDFVSAAAVARDLGFALPTTRIVDAIYTEAALRLDPIPLPAGPQMRSMAYILEHGIRVEAERAGRAPGALVAGNQKDLVLTGRLRDMPDREAIYGWHRQDGRPIQPLSLVHGMHYADYSHGIRLVADTVLVDGAPRAYLAALADPEVAPWLSREGPIPDAAALMQPRDTRAAVR